MASQYGHFIEREEGLGFQYRAFNEEGRVAGWLLNTGHLKETEERLGLQYRALNEKGRVAPQQLSRAPSSL